VNQGVRLFGPYAGKLDNAGDNLRLQKPTTPIAGVVPYVLMDEVEYRDASPWPAGADGYGLSLQRSTPLAYGNDPTNWVATLPTAATATLVATPPVIVTQPQSQSAVFHSQVTLTVAATGAAPLRYQWRFRGINLAGATNATLVLPAIEPEHAGDYTVAVFNGGGSAVSAPAVLDVLVPAVILVAPQNVSAVPGITVTFSVTAYSPIPLSYQWQFNGEDLPGRTGPTLTIPNVQPADGGDYTVLVSDALSTISSPKATLFVLVEPAIVVQPVSQSVIPGGPVTLSIAVTNTATLPIGIRIRRNLATLPAGPNTFFTIQSRQFFYTLTGTNAAPPWTNFTFIVTNRARVAGNVSAPAILDYVADTDGNGLPDAWETSFFGGLNTNPTADPDGDGMNNRAEYIAGTDPTDASSVLEIQSVTAPPGATIRFRAVANRTYTIQFTDALGAMPWQTLNSFVARATDRNETWIDSGYSSNRVYRLVSPQQP
jgi:hypothetical protein